MTENELMLFDRLEVIRTTNKKYNLENNAYISFSGGKDSTVLHHLIDEALPGNTIPRVFINTGIEYTAIVEFVKELAKDDSRFEIIAPKKKIKETLEIVGYPFKSKEHSKKVAQYQARHHLTEYLQRYINGDVLNGQFACPSVLRYQFTEKCNLKISHLCCQKLKKDPDDEYKKRTGKTVLITGMQRTEGGARNNLSCIVTHNGKAKKFHPLAPTNEEWEKWFIETRKIKLCKLYNPPYNFRRTGCKGCPFALDLQNNLDFMAMYLPAEKKQCEYIWAPVYAEYRRLGYRLRKDDGQMSLFDEV